MTATPRLSRLPQAAAFLRRQQRAMLIALACADHLLAGARHPDSRADRERIQARAGPFIEAMPGIRAEIAKLRSGDWPAADNPLGSAPHTLADVTGEWQRPWSLEQAPTSERLRQAHRYWPGERNLFCACVALVV